MDRVILRHMDGDNIKAWTGRSRIYLLGGDRINLLDDLYGLGSNGLY